MFYGCTGLTQAPELPATVLAYRCYYGMFYECTGLTQAPELPATVLADSCYSNMFSDCTALEEVTVAFTDWGDGSTYNWLSGVAATGTFTCPADLEEIRGESNIPEGWTIVRV